MYSFLSILTIFALRGSSYLYLSCQWPGGDLACAAFSSQAASWRETLAET